MYNIMFHGKLITQNSMYNSRDNPNFKPYASYSITKSWATLKNANNQTPHPKAI